MSPALPFHFKRPIAYRRGDLHQNPRTAPAAGCCMNPSLGRPVRLNAVPQGMA
jgi:hypothetical protein